MTRRPNSPFTGLSLSTPAQPRAPGPDQRLFTAVPLPSPDRTAAAIPLPSPSQLPPQESRKVGTLDALTGAAHAAAPHRRSAGPPPFALAAPATEKNSYMFSQEELWALKDVETEIERTYRTDVSKYNIVRLGLHMLLEDYFTHKENSFLVRRLHLERL